MLDNPRQKYKPFNAMPFPERTWPSKTIEKPPIWASVDLRDGNQAIKNPMNLGQKLHFFNLLKKVGFKEIEVGFPSASDTEYAFIRTLIEQDHIPHDVRIGVLTQAKEPLIRKTIESLNGVSKAILHLYAATAPQFRDTVFSKSKNEVKKMAVANVALVKELIQNKPDTDWMLEFSPEAFSQTERSFALDVCNAAIDAWGPTPRNKMILNLPATVEVCSPNQYADQIEWMCNHIKNRDSVIVSVHNHNDRGTAVAATENGILAGAQRVEGCVLGNGERTGNVDLVTLALNMYTQGIDPNLDFSNIAEVIKVVEECTGIPVHPRHPYAGEYVYTAFSGSHQDAIKKGQEAQENKQYWDVPYLPIDPKDVGRTYKKLIQFNSQSGKGGAAYLLEQELGVSIPKKLQIEFGQIMQTAAEKSGGDVSNQIWGAFEEEYLNDPKATLKYVSHKICHRKEGQPQRIGLTVTAKGTAMTLLGEGNGPIDASVKALGLPIDVPHYSEKSMGEGSDAKAIAFVELSVRDHVGSFFGVGIHNGVLTAPIKAVISGANRILKKGLVKLDDRYGQPIRNDDRGGDKMSAGLTASP